MNTSTIETKLAIEMGKTIMEKCQVMQNAEQNAASLEALKEEVENIYKIFNDGKDVDNKIAEYLNTSSGYKAYNTTKKAEQLAKTANTEKTDAS